jgi:hypothetical protein
LVTVGRDRGGAVKKLLVIMLCLLLCFAFVINVTGCGCGSEEQEQENGSGRKVEVPDVTGLSVEAAKEKLEESDLDCGIRGEEVEGGKVTGQDPEAGEMLTPDMTVYITVEK